jgi:DNA-binding MarR family transcriptional regulator
MTKPVLETSFENAEESAGLGLWRVTNAWQAAQRLALEPFRLTHVQFVLLASLTWLQDDDPVTQKRLAEHAGTDPMMTSQVLRTLEQKGLVERHPHPTDGRAKLLIVTAEGAALANRAIVAVETCDTAFFAPIGEQRTTLAALLGQLA